MSICWVRFIHFEMLMIIEVNKIEMIYVEAVKRWTDLKPNDNNKGI